jgi:hypothetical protein
MKFGDIPAPQPSPALKMEVWGPTNLLPLDITPGDDDNIHLTVNVNRQPQTW